VLTHSTTLGLRIRTEQRFTLDRRIDTIATAYGDIRVKVALEGERVMRRVPEFEDCRRAAETARVPVQTVYEAAIAAAHAGEGNK